MIVLNLSCDGKLNLNQIVDIAIFLSIYKLVPQLYLKS